MWARANVVCIGSLLYSSREAASPVSQGGLALYLLLPLLTPFLAEVGTTQATPPPPL